MVKRLIIDDRRTFMLDKEEDHTLHVRALDDAEQAIRSSAWDEVWFDFDMGPDNDMIPFARRIGSGELPMRASKVFIHSMSPPGRMYLQATLSRGWPVVMLPVSLISKVFDVD